jgi:hypothetical protein
MKTRIRRMPFIVLIIIFILIAETILSASIVTLKNGKKIEGEIIYTDTIQVTILEYNTGRTYLLKMSEIKDIKFEVKVKTKAFELSDTIGYRIQPILFVLPTYSIPLGAVNSILNPGYGALITMNFKTPFSLIDIKPFLLRYNVSSGFFYYKSSDPDVKASVFVIPTTICPEITYQFENNIRPYFAIGVGLTYASLTGSSEKSGSVQKSSVDGTLAAHIGVGYSNINIPNMEFLVDFGYLMMFETLSGQFFQISIGVGYKFFDITM